MPSPSSLRPQAPSLFAVIPAAGHSTRMGRPKLALPRGNRRGHPTLIRWKHGPGIRAHPCDEGLNKYLRLFEHETLELPADSPDVLLDLNTPQDYEMLRRRFA